MNLKTINTISEPIKSSILLLQVPRTNDKKELAAEQMFASLHGLLTAPNNQKNGLFASPRERISLEIAVLNKKIGFYVWVPEYIKDFVEDQIYAQYPNVQISEVTDYSLVESSDFSTMTATELKLKANKALPIKTFQSFEVDPLAAITGTLAKFNAHEEAWIQLIIQPASNNWHRKSESYIVKAKNGSSGFLSSYMSMLWATPNNSTAVKRPLTDYQQTKIAAAEAKSQKLAYDACVRIIYRSKLDTDQARLRLQSITASYRQFNTTYLNGFDESRNRDNTLLLKQYQQRLMGYSNIILNIEELATLYHLPHTNVETPYIMWASSQTAEPPSNLPFIDSQVETYPSLLSPIGFTNYRGHNSAFGMPRYDRGRHLYIIGQTGVGKSALLELLTIADLNSPYGLALIDPHGDYAQNILKRIPENRLKDVIYFNPADIDYPMSFNPMEVTDPKLKSHTASELIGVLKRMFDSWGPRLEYILRYALLALLDYPDSTMLDITKLLTDDKFRQEVLAYVTDTVVSNFWRVEFKSWNNKFAVEAVAPILNKVGAFTANPLVRNIIGQPHSSFNIRQIMDERKILIVNLTRGIIGEDNASILGALLVTKIQLAAMSRANVAVDQRHPFYLYVDEFQNFATESFATILSEARKYGLNLTVANQYIAQMPLEIRDAIFGNVGTLIAFRMGADDSMKTQRYFEPSFSELDLINMHNRHFVISMTIEGEKARPFSAITINLPDRPTDNSNEIIDNSRRLYALNKQQVEDYIHHRYAPNSSQVSKLSRDPEIKTTPTDPPLIQDQPSQNIDLLPKKRKRVRRSKNKSMLTTNDNGSYIAIHNNNDSNEHTIQLR